MAIKALDTHVVQLSLSEKPIAMHVDMWCGGNGGGLRNEPPPADTENRLVIETDLARRVRSVQEKVLPKPRNRRDGSPSYYRQMTSRSA